MRYGLSTDCICHDRFGFFSWLSNQNKPLFIMCLKIKLIKQASHLHQIQVHNYQHCQADSTPFDPFKAFPLRDSPHLQSR